MKKWVIFLMSITLLIGCRKQNDKENSSINADQEVSSDEMMDQNIRFFEKISESDSGITFINQIIENVETLENLFDFDYFYNGAGVGIEDINNDGLPDIFFCGNQVQNKLFLNKGNLTFEDITQSSNINDGKIWSNGVTFVDINNDGWKDIYVSQGGPNTRDKRKNLLFINQKNLTFKESAQEYGLADIGISTQSVFFDYDNDNDLDCFVMNENELYGLDPIGLYNNIKNNPEDLYFNSCHMYQNDSGKFVDVTQKTGMSRPFFGLGLCVSDINKDGWLDLYAASDYYLPDALYINNKNGTFTDQIKSYTNQISFYGMGVDIADINNDNLEDIFVLDMSSSDHVRSKTLMASMSVDQFDFLVNKADFQPQYMYNSLQLNQGNNRFQNIAQLTNMANTDWSWSVLMEDFNNDEKRDVYVTNGYRRYALDNDLRMKVFEAKKKYNGKIPLEVKKQLYREMPSEKLPNILYENRNHLTFKEVAAKWGLGDYSFSNGAASADLDNDGDLDLVVNNIDDNAFLYKNLTVEKKLGNFLKIKTKGENSEPFAKVTIKYGHKTQFAESKRVRGYMSSVEDMVHFGLGKTTKIDTITVEWLSGKVEERYNINVNTTLQFFEKKAKSPKLQLTVNDPYFSEISTKSLGLNYVHKENTYNDFENEILLPYKQSSLGPFISKGDVNGDSLMDIFIGGASGQAAELYLQSKTGFTKKHNEAFETDAIWEDMESIMFDFDNDDDLDIYVVSGGNEFKEGSKNYTDRLYLNDGNGHFSKYQSSALNKHSFSGKSVCVIDFDKDGDKDIIVGNRIIPQNYPKPAESVIYENKNGVLVDVTDSIAPSFKSFGIINKVLKTDFDNDGWEDFIVVGEWTHIGFFKNNQGSFIDISQQNGLSNEKGWWFETKEIDINNDGLKDYIVGNIGLNIKFSASKEKPFKIFANDFDSNGTLDIVLSKKYNDTYVPVRGRECSSQQMPFIKDKFQTYSEFANASLHDIYGEKLKNSIHLEANEFKSILLINKGAGQFEKKYLPILAQSFPILDCEVVDINNDGYKDLVLIGNIYDTEVETPRMDGGTGLVMLNNKKEDFIPISAKISGLYISGDVKSIEIIPYTKNSSILLACKNNGSISAFKILE